MVDPTGVPDAIEPELRAALRDPSADGPAWSAVLAALAEQPREFRARFARWFAGAMWDRGEILEPPPDRVIEATVLPWLLKGCRQDRMPELRWTFQLFRSRFAAFGRQLQLDGVVDGDGRALLERAVRVAPEDGASWRLLLRCHVDVLDFAQHHLDVEDELELDVEVCRRSQQRIGAILRDHAEVPPTLHRQAEQLAAMFRDYFDWLDGDRATSFRDWCRRHDRSWWFA